MRTQDKACPVSLLRHFPHMKSSPNRHCSHKFINNNDQPGQRPACHCHRLVSATPSGNRQLRQRSLRLNFDQILTVSIMTGPCSSFVPKEVLPRSEPASVEIVASVCSRVDEISRRIHSFVICFFCLCLITHKIIPRRKSHVAVLARLLFYTRGNEMKCDVFLGIVPGHRQQSQPLRKGNPGGSNVC